MKSILARVSAAGLVLLALVASSALAAAYPLGGYFIFHRGSDGDYNTLLNDIQSVGGKVIVTFGPEVRPVVGLPYQSSDPNDPYLSFNHCVIGGANCFTEAVSRLQPYGGASAIRRVYLMTSTQHYGDAHLLRCGGGLDVKVIPSVQSGVPGWFYRLIIPTVAKPPGSPCSFSPTEKFDVYMIWQNTPNYDRTDGLFRAANSRGMFVFMGLPVIPPVFTFNSTTQQWEIVGWNADVGAKDSFVELTKRFYQDWTTRYGTNASFYGLYQTFETSADSAQFLPDVLTMYTATNAAFKQHFPDKKILASPYWNSQKRYHASFSLTLVYDAARALAGTGLDVIATQDGRGTGGTAPFYPYQGGDTLPASLLPPNTPPPPAPPLTTYGTAYWASTHDMFKSARQGVDSYNAQFGASVQLWANAEAFEPTGNCSFIPLGPTTKDRVDTLIGFDKTHVSYLISFMWDPHFYCPGTTGLKNEILAQPSRPIIYDVQYGTYAGTTGLRLKGFNLGAGITISLTWYNSAWAIQSSNPAVQHVVATGSDGTTAWVPFNRSSMAPGWYLFMNANGGANGTSPLFVYVYPNAPVPPGSSFLDTTTHSLKTFVEWVNDRDLIAPCGLDLFCPDVPIVRADAAVALVRRGHGLGFVPSGPTGMFKDVPIGDWRSRWIEQLALDGITSGCGPGTFCPLGSVSRAQAAVLILKAKHGAGYTPPPATGIFSDVSPADPLRPWMEQMYLQGITGGCGTNPLRYCPADAVTRAQMSVFLQRITP